MKALKKFFKFLLKFILVIFIFIILCGVIIGIFSYVNYQKGYSSVTQDEKTRILSGVLQENIIITDSGSLRRTGNTFMSIPEWYIVSISHDYTTWLEAGKNPSDFPYIQYLEDFWFLYGRITGTLDGTIPRDYEYHTMVRVIGVSTTLEFGLKWAYEKSLGRLTSWYSFSTKEDRYFSTISRDYVDFILLRPWYEYDYTKAYSEFALSSYNIRSIERYFFYSIEFLGKKHYAKIIEDAAHANFAIPNIWTDLEGNFSSGTLLIDTSNIAASDTGIKITRYYPFTQVFPKILSLPDATVVSIAGNKRFVSEFISENSSDQSFLSLPIPTDPGKFRIFYFTDVQGFRELYSDTSQSLQHIYDF